MTALVVALVVSLPFLFILVARPLRRRIAVRNAVRRPVEALLVVAGTLLGTAIITGSLIVGDTIDRSIRASAYEQLGPVDETISVSGLSGGAALQDAFSGFEQPDVDGVLSLNTASAAVVGSGSRPLTRPRAQLVELDFADARRFGGDPAATGIEGATPKPGTAAVSRDLADRIALEPGDTITVYAYGQSLRLRVDRILPRTGLAGFWPANTGQRSYNVFVAPGTLSALVADAPAGDTAVSPRVEPPLGLVAISNAGGVESGADRTDVVTRALLRELESVGIDARVVPAKRDLIDQAVEGSKALSQLYFTIGMFAVAAGVLLLVNIFVMLADSRRSELGMIRALGLRRLPLVTTFATEGWLYAVIAATLGAILGIGVGRMIAWRAGQILSGGLERDAIEMQFTFDQATLVAGFAIGLAISMATIVLTSIRTARINIIAAIRDLPDTKARQVAGRRAAFGVVCVLLAAATTIFAFAAPDEYGIIIGPVLGVVGVGLLLAGHLSGRLLVTVVASVTLVWAIAAVPISTELGTTLDVPLFLVQGLMMSAAAIAIVVVQVDRIAHLLGRVSGDALALRVGLAYPLARRFRTAMTLGIFSIIVLTLVFMSQLSYMFRTQGTTLANELSGGFGAVVTSNPSNPIPVAALEEVPGVTGVAPMSYFLTTWIRSEEEDPVDWPVSGFGPELADAPPTLQDRGRFPSDAAAWEAVRTDPSLIIVDQFFATPGAGGTPPTPLEVGDEVVLVDRVSGARRTLSVAAIATDDYLVSGGFMGIGGVRNIFGDRAVPSRYYIGARDLERTVERIRAAFVANGADADTVTASVDQLLSVNSSFFTLMQQFVGVGLVVGIAGIGVIMVRAVRERRREIGVLRAIGFGKRTVASAFVVEAAFVAVAGTLMGVLIALTATWGLTTSNATWVRGFEYGVPWREVALIVILAVGAALLAAVLPARAASDIRPAAALRLEA